jgi:hypothetical protein
MCDSSAVNERIIENLLDQIDGLRAENANLKPAHVPQIKANSLLTVKPNIAPPLDPGFFPYVLGSKKYMENATAAAGCDDFHVAIERHAGLTTTFTVPCFPETHPNFDDSCIYIERKIKFLLWMKGGYKVYLSGNPIVCRYLTTTYSSTGARKFDADLMEQAYLEKFEVFIIKAKDMPAAKATSTAIALAVRCLNHTKPLTQQLIPCKYSPHKFHILNSLLRIPFRPCIFNWS